jgi:hypothetical protein
LAPLVMLAYMLPILILGVMLLLFPVIAFAVAVLLALATAPGLFRREAQPLVARTFIAHIVVVPIALLVGIVGSLLAQGSFTHVARMGADLVTASSTGGPYGPAITAVLSCAGACTLVCVATYFAQRPPTAAGSLSAVIMAVAIQLAVVVALIWCAGTLVQQQQTIFALSTETRFPALANSVRGGLPSRHEPVVGSGRLFTGPFAAKRQFKGGVQALLLTVPEWTSVSASVPIAIYFKPDRKRRPLSCPAISGTVFHCRSIVIAPNRPLDRFVLQREFAPTHFKHHEETDWFEFSDRAPDAWLWRAERCWLHLENWPAKGDMVQSEVDCKADWVPQAARLRELLDRRFPPAS